MKILYAIQGTGNGHISRALEIVPILKQKGETDVLISSSQWDLELPFEVKYRFHGLGFVFGKNGGIDFTKTYLALDTAKLLNEIKSIPIQEYDIIISDFEPISCWAAKLNNKVCIGLSNQAATLHPLAPKPKKSDPLGKAVLNHYAPVTHSYGFHFKSFDSSISTPIIRKEIRNAIPSNKGHITIYLPSYDDKRIIEKLKHFRDIEFQVFSKHIRKEYKKSNFLVKPLTNSAFIESLASSNGVITNAGFGTTSEALFLGKKLIVIPMKNQFEQHCNAAVLKSMGVTVIKSFKKKHLPEIKQWVKHGRSIEVNYIDNTEKIIDTIIEKHLNEKVIAKTTKKEMNFFEKIMSLKIDEN